LKRCGRSPSFVWHGTNLQPLNPDFKELLLAFNAHNVEYLIVGAHALAAHAWADRVETLFGGVPAFVISRDHLITNKKTAARLQDLADVEQLEATKDSV
jgi:hypothetical protein